MPPVRKAYRGYFRRLVVALDIGTTFSGVSYCLLDPGVIPKTVDVTRYPGQENAAGSSKIPSILYYDKSGNMRFAGAEAELPDNLDAIEDESLIRVEWFKLSLKPKSISSDAKITALPSVVTITGVFADFMKYLMDCTRSFFIEYSANGEQARWDALSGSTHFVISHPNGWEGPQQTKLREAAIRAGLIPDTIQGRDRVHFVTEGEASLHYCLSQEHIREARELESPGFVVADLGGGTLDFSVYKLTKLTPLTVEETCESKCVLQGSTFVTDRARVHLERKLRGSDYGTKDHISNIVNHFDKSTKKLFSPKTMTTQVQFGSPRDNDAKVGIRNGNLKMTREELADLFEPSIEAVVEAVTSMIKSSSHSIASLYLVGGFSASSYLIAEVTSRLSGRVSVGVPDGQTSKAVANGAISFYVDHHVSARVAKFTIGLHTNVVYNHMDPEHRKRAHLKFIQPSGHIYLRNGYSVILEKGTLVREEKEFIEPYSRQFGEFEQVYGETTVSAYVGPGKTPAWSDEPNTQKWFKDLFKIVPDASSINNAITFQNNQSTGKAYRQLDFSIGIMFGLTEFTAQMIWHIGPDEHR